jgi:uncharacterized protein YggE
MKLAPIFALASAFLLAVTASAQQPGMPEIKIDPNNRTVTVSANESVSVEPEIAVLHIGFDTQPQDAKAAYADGARISNGIVTAIKQAGIPESSIRSQSQYLQRDYSKPHKFKLSQQWTVTVPPERAAEILDIAVSAGATDSGDIDWTVKDEHALEEQALAQAAARAKENAEVLAKALGARLGTLIYASNQLTSPFVPRPMGISALSMDRNAAPPPPLAIEPHKVSREATVYAVFAIE